MTSTSSCGWCASAAACFPDIKEADYLGPRGYTIDDSAGKVTLGFPLLPGWDWDGKACTNSLLQHGPGLKASTEGSLQATHSAGCPCCQLAGSGTTSEACVIIGTSWTAAKRALQLCHAVRRNCRWPGALLQQQHLVQLLPCPVALCRTAPAQHAGCQVPESPCSLLCHCLTVPALRLYNQAHCQTALLWLA